jgi:prolyl oligopeptidase
MLRTLAALLLCCPLFAQNAPTDIQTFFKQAFEERLRDEPEFATSVGRHDYDDRWTDWSKTGREQRRTHYRARLQQLQSFPLAGLSAQDRLSAQLMDYDLRLQLEAFDLENELLRVSQQNGLHNRVYNIVDRMPSRTMRDYQNLLARLHAIPAYVDQNIALIEEAISHGVVQPKVVIDRVKAQLDAQLAQDQNQTALLAAFRDFPPAIPQSDRTRLKTEAVDAFEKQFLPAWRKYQGFIAGQYTASARAGVGLSSIANGRKDYATLAHLYTTTTTTPEEIHNIGLAEVERIESEMRGVLRQAGFNGSIAEYEKKLESSPDQHFHNKDEMLAFCRNIAKLVEPELPKQFLHVPGLLYGVRPIPADREQATATNAQAPMPDYSAPGWMNLNTYQPEQQVKYNKQALVLHEAVPGHVFQLTLAQGLAGIPEFRKFYSNSAYVEGWGLYAESLGAQLTVYTDPASHFGQLASERFRAVRLVVDTGLHTLNWTREQAIDYFKAHAPDQSIAEVDRYISWPGQALSYKMGQLRIIQLRREAEQKLGARFDIREFHDRVLRNGVLPLELLQREVQASLQ